MKNLVLGSRGPEVVRWQEFLRGLSPYSNVVTTGTFDAQTQQETREFQDASDLKKTGVVDAHTLAAAVAVGLAPVVSQTQQKPAAFNSFDREKIFGKFQFTPSPTPTNPEAIIVDPTWVKSNIVTLTVPQLAGVTGANKTGVVRCHKLVANNITSFFKSVEDAGLRHLILTWDGMWVPRFIRGSRTSLSNHAWGTAFDINAQWNGLGKVPTPSGKIGSVVDLVPIAKQCGFIWGGEWSNRPDGMHLECVSPMP